MVPTTTPDRTAWRPMVFMRFRPAWAYIDGIREFGRFFCETAFSDPDLAERARVVLQEALENAVKYSAKSSDSELEVLIQSDGAYIEFSVSSQPEPSHVERLKAELARIRSLDPEEAYASAFMRAAREPLESGRLGLARIRYEGGVELSLHEQDDGRVRITATGKL